MVVERFIKVALSVRDLDLSLFSDGWGKKTFG